MLMYRPFLLAQRPRFVDFDLYGILANFLYSGHNRLPAAHTSSPAMVPADDARPIQVICP